MVEPAMDFCMTTWLPFWRTCTNSCFIKMAQTSRPESLSSLPNVDLQRSDVNLGIEPLANLGWMSGLKKQLDGLFQIGPRFFNRVALTGNIHFITERDKAIIFSPDSCGQHTCHCCLRPPSIYCCGARHTLRRSALVVFGVNCNSPPAVPARKPERKRRATLSTRSLTESLPRGSYQL